MHISKEVQVILCKSTFTVFEVLIQRPLACGFVSVIVRSLYVCAGITEHVGRSTKF